MNKLLGAALFAALALSGCSGGNEVQTVRERLQAMSLPLEEVPLDVHRHAAQLLEDVRGSESAPGWEQATLGPQAVPMYRPDIEGVAYYELQVVVDGRPRGFIIASAGTHDFPITHWSSEGPSPSTELLEKAQGREVAAFYKVDSLSYVAEGPAGERVAELGQLPPRISGQDPKWLDDPPPSTQATWVLDSTPSNDGKAEGLTGHLVIEGPSKPADIKLDGWESWGQLKQGYRESYATMAESLRRQAAEDWTTDAEAREVGEGLVEGRVFELAVLYRQPAVELLGDGANLVQADLVESAPGRQLLLLLAKASQPGKEVPLVVRLRYPNGVIEELPFVVLSPKDVGANAATGGDVVLPMGPWSPWYEFWAGTHGDQRLYSQISSGVWPNTSGCASGCGATAWAMLFGWGDWQAALGNPSWWYRWGLYRQNGGTGADAAAPATMDAGVRNITWEMRNQIGTFCVPGGQGATFPWNMSNASQYLVQRTGATLGTNYNVLGIHTSGLRDTAANSIVNRRVPAIIGTGWLSHYPLAYGYRWRNRTVRHCFLFWCWNDTEYERQFYVNQGWGGSSNGWVNAGTWFAGQLYAN